MEADRRPRRPWDTPEDKRLCDIVALCGSTSWSDVAAMMPGRSAKQCRERWNNHLKPDVRKGPWTPEEDQIILQAIAELGPSWSKISKRLPGRTDAAVANRYHQTLKPIYEIGQRSAQPTVKNTSQLHSSVPTSSTRPAVPSQVELQQPKFSDVRIAEGSRTTAPTTVRTPADSPAPTIDNNLYTLLKPNSHLRSTTPAPLTSITPLSTSSDAAHSSKDDRVSRKRFIPLDPLAEGLSDHFPDDDIGTRKLPRLATLLSDKLEPVIRKIPPVTIHLDAPFPLPKVRLDPQPALPYPQRTGRIQTAPQVMESLSEFIATSRRSIRLARERHLTGHLSLEDEVQTPVPTLETRERDHFFMELLTRYAIDPKRQDSGHERLPPTTYAPWNQSNMKELDTSQSPGENRQPKPPSGTVTSPIYGAPGIKTSQRVTSLAACGTVTIGDAAAPRRLPRIADLLCDD